MTQAPPLLLAEGLSKSFLLSSGPFTARHRLRAVADVDLRLERGETLAIVGESGCGKSTVGRLLLRLQTPDAGRLELDGVDVLALNGLALRRFRRRVQVVFQDPYSSLDPRERIREVLTRPMILHGLYDKVRAEERAAALMEEVGLSAGQLARFPHQFSGGQRQRIAIARALSVEPDVIVCDEPVSALDVSMQAQIINLLQDLQARTGVALVFISHDLALVRHIASRVVVMYAGRVVETAEVAELFVNPRHPYTRALLAAAPRTDLGARRHAPLAGEPPNLALPEPGCRFASRCLHAQMACTMGQYPLLRGVAAGHSVACLFAESLPPPVGLVPRTDESFPVNVRIDAYRRARDSSAPNASERTPA